MLKYFLILQLLTSVPVFCGELRFGPRLGLLMPDRINDSRTNPGTGLYWGISVEYAFTPLFAVDFTTGAALGMGEPRGIPIPCLPSFSNEDADYYATNLTLSVNPAALSLAAGIAYYYIRMDWDQTLIGENTEWKTIELNKLGYCFSIGIEPIRNVSIDFTFNYPDLEHIWGVLSITTMPFKL